MAGFKEKIKERFKAKFPKVNLTNARLEEIANRLDAKTDDEEGIDAQLDLLNDLVPFADIAKQDDKIRDLEAKTKGKPQDPAAPAPTDPAPAPAPAEMPEWAKGLVTGIQTLTSELTAIKGEKVTTTRKEQLSEKLKDAPESYKNTVLKAFGRMKFDTDEAFEEYLTEAEADATAFIQEQSDLGLGNDKPGNGLSGGGNTGKASEAELDAALANFKI